MAPGATVIVTLPDAQPPVIVLPASALTRSADKPALLVVDAASRLQLRPVVLARFNAQQIFVTAGIKPESASSPPASAPCSLAKKWRFRRRFHEKNVWL